MKKPIKLKVKQRGVKDSESPTVLESQAEILAFLTESAGSSASKPEIPPILQQMMAREEEQQKEQTDAAEAVLRDFKSVGAFVRKIGDPNATDNPVTKDLTQMRDNATGGKNATQPFVRPATFVKSDIPINLTDAGGLIKDSSGLVFRADTQIAPSTKEHSKSVRLGNILRGQTDLSPDDWSGVIRHAVEEKGGRSFDEVKDLSLKMQELNDRRLGKIPDLSGKEMLVELFTFSQKEGKLPSDDKITAEWFSQILAAYSFPDPESGELQPLPSYIQEGLINKILVTIEDKNTEKFSLILSSLVKEVTNRKVREHSIYTQEKVGHKTNFDQFQPAARYYLSAQARKERAAQPKSEGFYDGSSFRTTEALMIPSDQDVGGVYVNTNSSQSLLQALYIANEFFVQTERVLPLFTYSAKEGLQPLTLAAVLDLMRDRLKKEQSPDQPTEAENPTVTRITIALGRDLTPDEKKGTKDFQADDMETLVKDQTIKPDEFDPVFKNLADLIKQKRLANPTPAPGSASDQSTHLALIQRVLQKDVSLAEEIKTKPLTPEQIQALAAHKAIDINDLPEALSSLASLIRRKRIELFTVKDVKEKTTAKPPQSSPKKRSPENPVWSGVSGKRKSDVRSSLSGISDPPAQGSGLEPNSEPKDQRRDILAEKAILDGINMSYEYEDLDMWKVLTLNFPDGNPNGIEVLAPIDNIYRGQLRLILEAQQDNRSAATKLLVPYNLGNYHWVGIYVAKQPNGSVTVTYMDPLRDRAAIPPQVKRELEAVYGAENVTFDTTRSYLIQKDRTSCGPITIHNLTALALAQDPTTPGETALSLRKLHVQQIMDNDSTSDFKTRQLNNTRTVTSKFDMRAYLEKNRIPDLSLDDTSLSSSAEQEQEVGASVDALLDSPSLVPTVATPKQLQDLIHFSRPNPFLKGRRAEIRPILTLLFDPDQLGCDVGTAIATKSSLYSIREEKLRWFQERLNEAFRGSKDSAQALLALLSSDNPISDVLRQNPEAFRRLLQKLPNTEESYATLEPINALLSQKLKPENPVTRAIKTALLQKQSTIIESRFKEFTSDPNDVRGTILSTLFNDLGCSRDQLFTTKTGLFSLSETELERLQTLLQNALEGDKDSSQDLFILLSSDNPISRVLLKNPKAFAKILNDCPDTSLTHRDIEDIENLLLNQQNLEIPFTIGIHEVCFKKKTTILEAVIADHISKSSSPKLSSIKKLKKEHYWKILIDGNVHEHDNKHFYDRSRGFMASMMKGLRQVVEGIDRPLNTDFVKELHTAATELVVDETSLTRPMVDIIRSVKGLDQDEPMPGLLNDLMKSLTPAQKAQVEKERAKIVMALSHFQERGIKRAANEWGVTRTYTPGGMSELATLRTELDNQAGAPYFSVGNIRFPNDPADVSWSAGGVRTPDQLQTTVKNLMDYVIAKAYREIDTAKRNDDQDAVIGAIIDCCRGLGIIHPFKDANGRLLMFLVLNKLLMEQGLLPTILEDQGFMVGKSKAELLQLIKDGQDQVADL